MNKLKLQFQHNLWKFKLIGHFTLSEKLIFLWIWSSKLLIKRAFLGYWCFSPLQNISLAIAPSCSWLFLKYTKQFLLYDVRSCWKTNLDRKVRDYQQIHLLQSFTPPPKKKRTKQNIHETKNQLSQPVWVQQLQSTCNIVPLSID